MGAQRQIGQSSDAMSTSAVERWQAAHASGGLASQLSGAQLLRAHPNWAVFVALAGEQSVIVKQYAHAGAADVVVAAATELQEVGPRLAEGPLQINQYLAHDTAQGVLVVSHVPDRGLQSVLDDPDTDRSAILRQCGDWLTQYIGNRVTAGKFAPFYWQEQLVNTSFKALSPPDRKLAHGMRSNLRKLAEKLRSFELRRIAGHGDFATHNFGYEDGVLYGYDVQGETQRPLVQELAHFLVLATMKSPPFQEAHYIGLREADVAALCIQAGLPELEYETVFRYLIGWYMCRFIARYADNPQRVSALRVMLTKALADWPA